MGEIMAVAEIIVFAKDMDAQVRFYRDVLGLAVRSPQGRASYADQYWVEFETGACTLVLHGGGQGRSGPDAPKIAFEVADIEAARAALVRRGATLGEVRSPAAGVKVCDGVDPEGNRFSIDSHG